jgi:hypothetical protein
VALDIVNFTIVRSIKFGCVVMFKFDYNFRVPAKARRFYECTLSKAVLLTHDRKKAWSLLLPRATTTVCRPSKETVRTCKAESGGTVSATVPQPPAAFYFTASPLSPAPFLPTPPKATRKPVSPSSATFAGHGVTHTTLLQYTPHPQPPSRPAQRPCLPRHATT